MKVHNIFLRYAFLVNKFLSKVSNGDIGTGYKVCSKAIKTAEFNHWRRD